MNFAKKQLAQEMPNVFTNYIMGTPIYNQIAHNKLREGDYVFWLQIVPEKSTTKGTEYQMIYAKIKKLKRKFYDIPDGTEAKRLRSAD